MKKLLLVSLCFLMLCITQVSAQNRTVTGTVTAKDDGLPLPGVTVKVRGTTNGAVTNTAGKYVLPGVPAGAVLQFSFIGYQQQQIAATGNIVNAVLVSSSTQLGEVVVSSALGIKRQAKELGYAATNIGAKQLDETHPTNFTNGLTAKAPGLVISTLDNGIDPTTRFTLRGNRHIVGNNYALVLLNGVPISPNDVNTISPDDIESIDVLNGAGAASLYGSEASNGALSITTKRGSATGAPTITYSNTLLAERLSYFSKLQTDFGGYGGEGGVNVKPNDPYNGYVDPYTGLITKEVPYENQSYGPRYDGSIQQLGLPALSETGPIQLLPYRTPPGGDPRYKFFQTGISDQNNLSYAQGDALNSFNLSINNLAKKGTVPNDRYDRTVVRLGATKTYGILSASFTASYSRLNTSTYGNGYDGSSLLSTLVNSPSWVPLTNYKDINAQFSDVNSWFNSYGINPYWQVQKSRFDTQSDNFNGSFNLKLTPTKWFDITYRLADNYGVASQQFTRAQVNFSAYYRGDFQGTQNRSYGAFGSAFNTPGSIPGQVQNITQYGDGSISGINNVGAGPQGYSRLTQDILANFHHTFFHDFKANLLVGSSIWEESYRQISNSSNQLLIDGFYNIGSILGVPTTTYNNGYIRQIAFFGDLTLSYKDFIFIEASDRNDRDSRLSAANRSFFYPSVKASLLLTQAIPALRDIKALSYAKLRASYSKVGDINTSPYTINNTFNVTNGFPYGNLGGLNVSTTLNNPNLKPEFTKELEFGGDFGFLDNRINASITYYKSNTTNQTLPVTTSPSTGYQNAQINIGELQNTGFETKLDVQVLTKAQNGVGLNLVGNFTIQDSKVISLTAGLPSLVLTTITNGTGASNISAVVGQPYPTLMGSDLNRDPQGRVIVDPISGNPSLKTGFVNLGRTTPKYLLGLTQTLSYKFVSLSVTSEFRTGNVIYNGGEITATASGASALSASSGRQRFVFPNSVINTGTAANPVYVPNTNTTTKDGDINFFDAAAFYSAASSYVTSAAFWKLREADLNFDLTQFVKGSKFIKRASFSVIGRNLLMWRPKSNTWSDPEFSSTTGNSVGYETNQLPPSRFFGANLTVTF
jgi:TonB-linked SusC/RagA family outer membrane protein